MDISLNKCTREPDFFLIETENKNSDRIHKCWIERSFKYQRRNAYFVSVEPSLEYKQVDGDSINLDLIILTQRCHKIAVLPKKKNAIQYFLMKLFYWPYSVYVLKHSGLSCDIGSEVFKDSIDIISWGEIHPTISGAEKSLRWWRK